MSLIFQMLVIFPPLQGGKASLHLIQYPTQLQKGFTFERRHDRMWQVFLYKSQKFFCRKSEKPSRKQTNKTRSFVWSTLEQVHPSPNQEQLDPGYFSHVFFFTEKNLSHLDRNVSKLWNGRNLKISSIWELIYRYSKQLTGVPCLINLHFLTPTLQTKSLFGRFHANQMFTNSSLFPETLSKMCQKTRPRRDQCRCSHPWKLGTTPRHEIPWVPPCFVGKMVVPSL